MNGNEKDIIIFHNFRKEENYEIVSYICDIYYFTLRLRSDQAKGFSTKRHRNKREHGRRQHLFLFTDFENRDDKVVVIDVVLYQ